MKVQTSVYLFILVFYATQGFATSSFCIDYLEQKSTLSYVLLSDMDAKLKPLSYIERIEKLGEEVQRVQSEMEINSRLVDRMLSKSIRAEYQKLQERLNFLNAQIEQLREIENIVYSYPIVDKKMDVKLTQRLLESRSLRRRLTYMNQKVLESTNIHEKDFTTFIAHHILYGEDFDFITMPFSHWLTLNILHGRHAQGHLEYLNEALRQTDLEARKPEQIGPLNETLAHALMDLDPEDQAAYITTAVDGGLIVSLDQIERSTKKSKTGSGGVTGSADTPMDSYHESNDQGPPSGSGIYSTDGGDMGGGGGGPH